MKGQNTDTAWQIVRRQSLVTTPWASVDLVDFRLPNDRGVHNYLIVDQPPVCVVLPLLGGKTFLIEEYERGIDRIGYKLPGGRIDPDESPEVAARREAKEELGITACTMTRLGLASVDPGRMTTLAHYFLATEIVLNPSAKVEDPTELFTGSWTDIDTVAAMVDNNTIINPFVIVAFSLFRSHMRRHE